MKRLYGYIASRNLVKLPLVALVATFALTALAPTAGCVDKPASIDTPNIVLILADDLGWGDLGVYGAAAIETPHCDRLASEGVRFTDAHSASAVCSPSRYGVLTGRYGWRTWLKNGVLMEHMPLLIAPGRVTLPAMLKHEGYTTACIGKWHLGWGSEIDVNWKEEVAPGPLEVGFDYFFGIPFSHASSYLLRFYMENRRVVGLRPGESLDQLDTMKRITRQLDTTGKKLTEVAVGFIEENAERPFFLYFPTTNVHTPWTPDRQFLGSSEAGKYGDFVTEFDWIVGQVTDALDRMGLAERTLLIVTSDNGANERADMMDHQPNGSWRGMKGQVYEAGHRVPFIARWPGRIEPGGVCGETIGLVDMMATLASVVGYELPDSAGEDSHNILPALLGDCKPGNGGDRGAMVFHSMTGVYAIREGNWKLIEGAGGGGMEVPELWPVVKQEARLQPQRAGGTGNFREVWYDFRDGKPDPAVPPGQLFDLETDPQETSNLWDEHPDVVNRLQALLDKYRREGRSR